MDKPCILTLRLVIDCSMTAATTWTLRMKIHDNNDNGKDNEMAMIRIVMLLQLMLLLMMMVKDIMTMAASSAEKARHGQLPEGWPGVDC